MGGAVGVRGRAHSTDRERVQTRRPVPASMHRSAFGRYAAESRVSLLTSVIRHTPRD
jgi:hypothetical protein